MAPLQRTSNVNRELRGFAQLVEGTARVTPPGSRSATPHMERPTSLWLPSSSYEWASKSDVELYFGPNMTADDYRSQIWLPIEKRQA